MHSNPPPRRRLQINTVKWYHCAEPTTDFGLIGILMSGGAMRVQLAFDGIIISQQLIIFRPRAFMISSSMPAIRASSAGLFLVLI